jgi:hypothetical protein
MRCTPPSQESFELGITNKLYFRVMPSTVNRLRFHSI